MPETNPRKLTAAAIKAVKQGRRLRRPAPVTPVFPVAHLSDLRPMHDVSMEDGPTRHD